MSIFSISNQKFKLFNIMHKWVKCQYYEQLVKRLKQLYFTQVVTRLNKST